MQRCRIKSMLSLSLQVFFIGKSFSAVGQSSVIAVFFIDCDWQTLGLRTGESGGARPVHCQLQVEQHKSAELIPRHYFIQKILAIYKTFRLLYSYLTMNRSFGGKCHCCSCLEWAPFLPCSSIHVTAYSSCQDLRIENRSFFNAHFDIVSIKWRFFVYAATP